MLNTKIKDELSLRAEIDVGEICSRCAKDEFYYDTGCKCWRYNGGTDYCPYSAKIEKIIRLCDELDKTVDGVFEELKDQDVARPLSYGDYKLIEADIECKTFEHLHSA